jgi:acyl-CoA synthetase (AMP-forming)/AMP-acid ligase II
MTTTTTAFAELRETIERSPRPNNVSELLDSAAARFAERPVLNFFEEGEALTFGELRSLSLRMAFELRSRGVGVGTAVAVVSPNVPLFPVTWLALLRLGAVLVPINPRYTADEMGFVLDDSGAQFVVAHETSEHIVQEASYDIIDQSRVMIGQGITLDSFTVEGDRCQLTSSVDGMDWPAIGAHDIAGYHYTSGTTGFPKGCVLSHESWLVAAAVLAGVLPRPPRRILSDTPFFYMDAPMELMLALACGAEQYVARRPSLSKAIRWIAEHDIDYSELWEALSERVPDPESEAKLRQRRATLMASTYGLKAGSRAQLERRLNANVREFFGMTEIGIGMIEPFTDDVDDGSCGVAAPFRQTRVVNPATGCDVDGDAVGELWVRGPGILKRYHNRPDTNREVFVDGWFRTGDLVTVSATGRHHLVGRIKDMIRRSHENIAATEVEEALKQMPGIASAAVVGVADPLRGEEVKAFIVLDDGLGCDTLTPEAILTHAAKVLASFKVPRYVEYMDELPMTPSGKVSKAKLKALDPNSPPFGWDAVEKTWTNR